MNDSNKRTCLSNDWISGLPDEVLQYILSLLRTKEAVQTSLVSKRWVNLCASLSCLNFDVAKFVGESDGLLERKKNYAKFKNFVETVLSRHEASFLDTLAIRFPGILYRGRSSDLVRTCVSYAMKFSPRVFSMEARVPSADSFACIFACESIEEMCLCISIQHQGDCYPKVIPEAVKLPRVRRLRLGDCELDNSSITRLVSGCPVLEELSLEYCSGEFSSIFSQKLKYLSLSECYLNLPNSEKNVWIHSMIESNLPGDTGELTIEVEQLTQFKSIWKNSGATAVDNTSSFMQNFIHCLDLGDHFGSLSGVTDLELHSTGLKNFLQKWLPKVGEFHNLKSLTLGRYCMICDFNSVALFLQKSPNLEKLTLYNCRDDCRMGKTSNHRMLDNLISIWAELSRCQNLKLVEIKFLKDLMRVHDIEVALLQSRKEIENIEVVLSEIDY